MITIPRVWAMLAGMIISLITIPLAFDGVFLSLSDPQGAMVIALVTELIVYFILTIFSSPKATIASSALISLVLMGLRFAGCFVAAMLAGSGGPNAPGLMDLWVGNPVSAIVQGLILAMLGTHVLATFLPDAVGSEVVSRIGNENRASRDSGPQVQQTSASGGFVQVYSYEELSGVLRKTQGLEGFLVVSSEGLIVWRELPMRIEVEALVARTLSMMDQYGTVMESSGLTRVRRVMVESKEHLLFTTPLNLNFGLLMLFSSRTPMEEILGRIGFMTKTSREFLQWKYPALPLATGLSSERNPLITT
jgi:predicted regulator of Ras-like GTPase activity (Roadblock/LC7/MglB family)